jgi:hypothetical protein
LLIPINKCLAVKIRKYSENMMEKKDSRVKVHQTTATKPKIFDNPRKGTEIDAQECLEKIHHVCLYFFIT